MKRFSIPGYFRNFDLCKMLIELYKTDKELFYQDRIIDSSYDLPNGLIWNGGRVNTSLNYNIYDVDDCLSYYFNETNISLAHTCTNLLIDHELAQDWNCNLFIHNYYRPDKDHIIVASKDLYEHLNNTYEKINFIISTTLNITDLNHVNQASQDNIFVLNYVYNNNDEYLQQLNNKDHIEIICAEPCNFNCYNRQKHYEELSKSQLSLIDWDDPDFCQCPYHAEERTFSQIQKMPHAISNARIDQLSEQGFQYFKISGRTINPIQWIMTMTYYLIQPEHRELVREQLIKNFLND